VTHRKEKRTKGRAVMSSQTPDAWVERGLALCLALIAGSVDAYGFRAFGTYVSFMSGNTTTAGVLTGQSEVAAAVPAALAIVSFVIGSFTGTWLGHSSSHQSRRLLFGLVAALLAVVIGVASFGSGVTLLGVIALSLGMGMMNTTLSQIGAERINLTFVTGTLSRIGAHLALAARRTHLEDPQGPRDNHLRRAGLLGTEWASFLIGAVLSSAVFASVGPWVLLPSVIALAAFAFLAPRAPSAERQGRAPC
jgi:uncharacterized membrane protein YoaK (UPF0700 family)